MFELGESASARREKLFTYYSTIEPLDIQNLKMAFATEFLLPKRSISLTIKMPASTNSEDEVGGGSKSDKSSESSDNKEESRSSGRSRVRFKPKYNRRKKRQHGWQGVSIPLFDYLGSKFKDLTTLKRSGHRQTQWHSIIYS